MLKSNTNTKLRTQECWERYRSTPKQKFNSCFLCNENGEIVRRYKHWFIIKNCFPYDAVASVHHMLVPKEHLCNEFTLSPETLTELYVILAELEIEDNYDAIMRNFASAQSHQSHLHYHLLTWART